MTTSLYYTANHQSTTENLPSALYTGGRIHTMYDSHTVTAEEGEHEVLEIEFPRLLPGKVIVIPALSWIRADDAEANADLHLGYRAYVDSSGTTQPADDNYWMDNVDVGGGDKQGLWPAITGVTTAGARPTVFDAQDGLRIFITVDTADANVGDVYSLVVTYIHIQ